MPTVQADSHRGKVCQALQTDDWMDWSDVADTVNYPVNGDSKVLGDVCRAGYVKRRDTGKRGDVEFEYQLKTNISIR